VSNNFCCFTRCFAFSSSRFFFLIFFFFFFFCFFFSVAVSAPSPFSAARFRDDVVAALKGSNVPVKDGRLRGVFGERERLTSHGLGQTTLNRDTAIETAQNYFLNGNASKATLDRHGYAATWGAPGTGKTHLIDELLAWMAEKNQFVPIVANFNGAHTGYVFGVDGLLVRMLFSHFVGLARPLVDKRPDFAIAAPTLHALVQENKVHYLQVIDTILYDVDDTRPVVERRIAALFVDEIRKATANESDMEPCVRVYRAVVDALTDPNVRLLLTALDQVSAFGIMDDRLDASASGCPITWLSLPPVDVDVVDGDRLLERCVALAHGHPRSTELVLCERKSHKADDAQSLIKHIEKSIAGKARAPVVPFLAPALMSIRLRMNEKFDNSELSFGATIRGAALLNSCAYDGEELELARSVPLLDLYSLRRAANFLEGILCESVEKLCDLLHKMVSGEEYEKLHAHWETTLRCLFYKHRIALKCTASMPLLSDSPANDDFPLALYRGVTFLTSSGRSVMVRAAACKPVLCLKERLSDTLTEWHDTRGEEVEQIEVGQTVVAGERNAGFDLATLFEEAGKKKTRKHLLLIECEHSPADTGSVQGWDRDNAATDDNDADLGAIPARAASATVTDDNDDDLVDDRHGKEKAKTRKVKVRVRKGERNARPAAAVAAKKGPDGLSTKMQIMSQTVARVLKSDQHLFVRSGITEESQITYLFVLLRPITGTFIREAKAWMIKHEIKFNVAVIARDALLALYGPSLRGAVALVLKAEDE
jgi:hypothetical protein